MKITSETLLRNGWHNSWIGGKRRWHNDELHNKRLSEGTIHFLSLKEAKELYTKYQSSRDTAHD